MTLYEWKERRCRKEEIRGNQGEAKGREDRLRVAGRGDDEECGEREEEIGRERGKRLG